MEELFALLMRPQDYACTWRDGELYIEAADPETAQAGEAHGQVETDSDDKIAA
jgi:hypothetical protein